jgi:uncharacterized membrane protein
MSDFLAVTFDGADDADAALRSIRGLEHADKVGLEDTAVVRKDAAGTVTIHNEMSSGTETGAVVGAVLGGLVLAVFPPAGIAAGAAVGGMVGRAWKGGIDGNFVKEVGGDLPAGGSALFLQLKPQTDTGLLVGALGQFHGRVKQTSLDDEIEKALDDSMR